MAKKNFFQRIIRSRGAWIGGILGYIIFAINPLASYLDFLPMKDIILFLGITYGLIELIVIGLLVGYMVEINFFKPKRRKRR